MADMLFFGVEFDASLREKVTALISELERTVGQQLFYHTPIFVHTDRGIEAVPGDQVAFEIRSRDGSITGRAMAYIWIPADGKKTKTVKSEELLTHG